MFLSLYLVLFSFLVPPRLITSISHMHHVQFCFPCLVMSDVFFLCSPHCPSPCYPVCVFKSSVSLCLLLYCPRLLCSPVINRWPARPHSPRVEHSWAPLRLPEGSRHKKRSSSCYSEGAGDCCHSFTLYTSPGSFIHAPPTHTSVYNISVHYTCTSVHTNFDCLYI